MPGTRSARRLAAAVAAISLAVAGQATGLSAAEPDRIEGRMLDRAGRALPGRVLVYANPGPGRETEPERVIAAAEAAIDGRFVVAVPPSAELRRIAAANGGHLNLVIVGTGRGEGGAVALSHALGRAGAPDVLLRTTERLAVDRPGAGPGPGRGTLAADYVGCGWTPVQTWNTDMVVGEIHTWDDMTGRFTYGQTADSDVGVGWSTDGKAWKLSGGIHVGNSSSTAAWKDAGPFFGYRLKSGFRYVKYRTDDPMDCGGGFRYKIQATQWNGGMVLGQNDASLDGKCRATYPNNTATFAAGTGFSRASSDFITFDAAASVGGASLWARSGASTYVKAEWWFGRKLAQYRLCGTTNAPTLAPRIFAGG